MTAATDSHATPEPGPGSPPAGERGRRTRWLYVRVVVVQALTLLALWLLQRTFGSP